MIDKLENSAKIHIFVSKCRHENKFHKKKKEENANKGRKQRKWTSGISGGKCDLKRTFREKLKTMSR